MKPVDRTKKLNIKCEHCKHWRELGLCVCKESPKCGTNTNYYNRCKGFEWSENGKGGGC